MRIDIDPRLPNPALHLNECGEHRTPQFPVSPHDVGGYAVHRMTKKCSDFEILITEKLSVNQSTKGVLANDGPPLYSPYSSSAFNYAIIGYVKRKSARKEHETPRRTRFRRLINQSFSQRGAARKVGAVRSTAQK
jgi:hypothetical protein